MSEVNEWLISLSEYIGRMSDELDNAKAENAKLRVERDEWHRVAVSKQDIIDHMRDARAENTKLRELVSRAWGLFLKHGAVHPCDLLEVDAVRDEMRELGIEVDDA